MSTKKGQTVLGKIFAYMDVADMDSEDGVD